MKKCLLLLYLCFWGVCRIVAIPARFAPIRVVQNDSTELTIYLRGDESFHYFVTDDGVPLLQGEDMSYYYAASQNSILINSGILAHRKELRDFEEHQFIRKHKKNAISVIEERCNLLNNKRQNERSQVLKSNSQKSIGEKNPHIGQKKGLVILVNFPDCSMSEENARICFDDFFNKVGYNKNNHIGSVHDYFYDQSYGHFDLTFDVVGPVEVSRNLSHYGANSSWNSRNDIHIGKMVSEACSLADEHVDFANYDWNNDGEVEQVFLIYAGYGESSGAPSYTIWPHKFSLTGCAYYGDGDGKMVLDGVIVDTYACSCELAGLSGKTLNGIGTACHEFSHCLGLPDFYDVNYNGGFGMSAWDLMNSGGHNGPNGLGEVPCGYSAYERWFAGWLTFTELNNGDRIENMPCIGDEPLAYIMYNDGNRNECFILENRQNERWFSYVNTSNKCHGLLVYHVDYSLDAWDKHAINVLPNHQRMSVVPADRNYGYFYNNGTDKGYNPSDEDFEGDLFPGSKNVTEFTNTSHTNVGGKLFNMNTDGTYNLNKPITNIAESDGLISFDFMGGKQVPAPTLNDATHIKPGGFTISWTSELEVDSFSIESYRVNDKTILFSENFDKFTNVLNELDGVLELSGMLDAYTQSKGWTGKNLYTSHKGIKIGSTQKQGALKTPLIKTDSENLTLKISISSANSSSPILVSLLDKDGYTVDAQKVCVATELTDIVLCFDNLPMDKYAFSFTGNSPFYMEDLAVFEGLLTVEEVKNYYNLQYAVRIDGVTATSYTFEGLRPGLYRYRVKAMMGNLSSEWSAYKEVELRNADAVSSVPFELNTPIAIYTMNGQKVNEMTTSGVYILDYGIYRKKIVYTGR